MDFQERKIHSEYWQKRLEAKEYYSSLGKVWCPTLSDWVVFNAYGFNHLIRKGGSLRSEKEQMRRFGLLRFIINIITDYEIDLFVRQGEEVFFWGLEKTIGDQIITIVIRQFKGGPKHFFSIMNEKSK